MSFKPASEPAPAGLAHHAGMAVRDWLETQSRITRYWRDVLMESGGDDALIGALDDHAAFLDAAARLGEGKIQQTQ